MSYGYPGKRREQWRMLFPNCPEWVISLVLGPFADEVGWPAVYFRWLLDGLVVGYLALAVFPLEVLLQAVFWLWVTMCLIYVVTKRWLGP